MGMVIFSGTFLKSKLGKWVSGSGSSTLAGVQPSEPQKACPPAAAVNYQDVDMPSALQDGVMSDAAAQPFDLRKPDMHEMKRVGEREKELLPTIAKVVESIVSRNDNQGTDCNVTAFHALKAPTVALGDYLERIRKYSSCSPCCFVIGLIYIDRLLQKDSSFVLSSLNVHRLLLTSVLTASKFLDDFYYNNAYWAKVGGIPCEELNTLELELLFKLNFDLHVMTDEYLHYRDELVDQRDGTAGGEGMEEDDSAAAETRAATMQLERAEICNVFGEPSPHVLAALQSEQADDGGMQ